MTRHGPGFTFTKSDFTALLFCKMNEPYNKNEMSSF